MIVDRHGERARLPDPEPDLTDEAWDMLGDALLARVRKAGLPQAAVARVFYTSPADVSRRLAAIPADALPFLESAPLDVLLDELAEVGRWDD